jgi:hypothetical protein
LCRGKQLPRLCWYSLWGRNWPHFFHQDAWKLVSGRSTSLEIEATSLQPCWCGVDGHSRYGAETFDAGNGLNCEGIERKVELALVTINQPQLLAVCSNLESSPDINN